MTIYRGYGGVNREIKQQFRGLGGVNREIKEQYRSYGGINRKVFQNSPSNALYWNGDECIGVTGGWLARNMYAKAHQPGTKNAASLFCQISAVNSSSFFRTTSPINLAPFSKMKILMDYSNLLYAASGGNHSTGRFCVDDNTYPNEVDYFNNIAGWDSGAGITTATDQIIEVNILALSASYYIVAGIYSGASRSAAASVTIKQIWLE